MPRSTSLPAVESDSPAGRAGRGLGNTDGCRSNHRISFTCHTRWQGSPSVQPCVEPDQPTRVGTMRGDGDPEVDEDHADERQRPSQVEPLDAWRAPGAGCRVADYRHAHLTEPSVIEIDRPAQTRG